MAVGVSSNRFENWARTGGRYDFQHLMMDNRTLIYGVECTIDAGDRYVAGGVDVDLRQGSAREILFVVIGHFDGPGADAKYDYANGHIRILNANGAEIAANTAIGNSTFDALVFARE